MNRYEIHAIGLGGMGVIQLSKLITRAAVMHENKLAVQTEAYSQSARGGKAWADVVIELDNVETMIDYPKALSPYDFLFVLSEEAARDTRKDDLKPGGWCLWDPSIISRFKTASKFASMALPAQEIAVREFGEVVIGSSILYGAFTSLSGVIGKEAALAVLGDAVPGSKLDINTCAFERGYELAEARKQEPRIPEKDAADKEA
jgi:Pyruvate/2-oxoacid:ferredoxin oxidoreductase gamma subunit